jgi:hypothetical protein
MTDFIILKGTEKDRLYGLALAVEAKDVRFDGIQDGFRFEDKEILPHLCFTLHNGFGTTFLLPLNATIADMNRKKIEKTGIKDKEE